MELHAITSMVLVNAKPDLEEISVWTVALKVTMESNAQKNVTVKMVQPAHRLMGHVNAGKVGKV